MDKHHVKLKPKRLEVDIQREICDYLASKQYFFWRQNNIPVINKNGSFRAMPKYSKKGVPDIILILYGGTVVFLEVKRKNGKLSDSQIQFQSDCKKQKIDYHVVCSVDDIIKLGL